MIFIDSPNLSKNTKKSLHLWIVNDALLHSDDEEE